MYSSIRTLDWNLAQNRVEVRAIVQGTTSPPEIKLGIESLKTVDKFVCLRSVIISTLFMGEDLTGRTGNVTAAFKKLR